MPPAPLGWYLEISVEELGILLSEKYDENRQLKVELSKTLQEKFCLEIAFNEYKEHIHVLSSGKVGNILQLNSKSIYLEKVNSVLKAQLSKLRMLWGV